MAGFILLMRRRETASRRAEGAPEPLIPMLSGIPLFPRRRPPSRRRWTTCISSSWRVTAFFALLVVVLVDRTSRSSTATTPAEGRRADHRLDSARDRLVAHPVLHLDGDLRLGDGRLLPDRAAARPDARDLRDRQAVDVALPARRRPARDQRAARAGRPAGQGHVHVRGRAARPLHPGVPREGRRHSGPLQLDLVHGDQDRRIPPVLRRVLRHQPLGDGRHGRT